MTRTIHSTPTLRLAYDKKSRTRLAGNHRHTHRAIAEPLAAAHTAPPPALGSNLSARGGASSWTRDTVLLACIKGHIRQVQFCIFMTTVEGSLEPLCCLTHSIIEAHRRRGVTKRSRSLASVSSRPLVIGLAAPVPRPGPAPSHANVQLPSPALEIGREGEKQGGVSQCCLLH